jgi:8-oxo-dGTP pyrophosphatase MutT (NUDIX family)
MKQAALNTFRSYIEPVFRRPDYVQTAALCLRDVADGPEVLLISSLSSRRWILPKGWPMRGRTLAEAALQEAWEEAGVKGTVSEPSLGAFSYQKLVKGGIPVTCRCEVYHVQVQDLAGTFPEQGRRKRKWVPVAKAASLVAEPELKAILADL